MPADISFTLRVTDVPAAVAEMQKFKAAAKASADGAGSAFKGFGHDIESVKGHVEGVIHAIEKIAAVVGVAFGVREVVEFVKTAAEAAHQMETSAEKLGTTTSSYGALAYAAKLADVEQQRMNAGLARLDTELSKFASGTSQHKAAFAALKLRPEDFAGKDTVQAFGVLSKAMAGIKGDAEKVALANQLMGRSGYQLIPVMNRVGEEGLGPLKQRLIDAGLIMSDEVTADAARLGRSLHELGIVATNAGADFASGLSGPAIVALGELQGGLAGNKNTFIEWGADVGGAILDAVTLLREFKREMEFKDVKIGGVLDASKVKNAVGGLLGFVTGWDDVKDAFKEAHDIAHKLEVEQGLTPIGPPQVLADEKTESDRRKRQLKLEAGAATAASEKKARQRKAVDDELKLAKDTAANQEEFDRAQYDQHLIDLDAYWAKRHQIQNAEQEMELRSLNKSGASPLQLAAFDQQAARQRLVLNEEERKARERADLDHLEAIKKQQEADGRRHAAALTNIQIEALKMKQAGQDPTRFVAAETAKENFKDASLDTEVALKDLATQREEIQAKGISIGENELVTRQKIVDLARSELPTLQALVDIEKSLAKTAEDRAKVAEHQAALDKATAGFKGAAVAAHTFGQEVRNIGQSGLADIFVGATHGADAFTNALLNALDAFERLGAQRLAEGIFNLIFPVKVAGGGLVGHAGGGPVVGPGTGTSDSIPALLSNGEFVMPTSVTSEPGAMKKLEFIRKWGLGDVRLAPTHQHFAEGGPVGGGYTPLATRASAAHAAASGAGEVHRVVIEAPEDMVLRHVSGSAGQRVLVELVSNNRGPIKRALGS